MYYRKSRRNRQKRPVSKHRFKLITSSLSKRNLQKKKFAKHFKTGMFTDDYIDELHFKFYKQVVEDIENTLRHKLKRKGIVFLKEKIQITNTQKNTILDLLEKAKGDFFKVLVEQKNYCVKLGEYEKKQIRSLNKVLDKATTQYEFLNLLDIHSSKHKNKIHNNSKHNIFSFVNNYIRSKLGVGLGLHNKIENDPHDIFVVMISDQTNIKHASTCIIDKTKQLIEVFDPSFVRGHALYIGMLLGHGFPSYKVHFPVDINIQEQSDSKIKKEDQDLFCIMWCYHYIQRRLLEKMYPQNYRLMFELVINDEYNYHENVRQEIVAYVLNNMSPSLLQVFDEIN